MRAAFPIHALTLVLISVLLSACGSTPKVTNNSDDELNDVFRTLKRSKSPTAPKVRSVGALQAQLGLNRRPSDLGYAERTFNPCQYGLSDNCEDHYLTVINFQLLCRDSEGTVSSIPISLRPIVSPQISWAVAGQSGGAPTDREGYGHLTVVSDRTIRDHRLVIRKGPNYVGVSVNDISKLVLPKNWCRGGQG